MSELTRRPTPLASWQARQGSGRDKVAVLDRQDNSSTGGVALAILKRSRWCIVAKLVEATPLGETVLAMPYRHRQTVNHVSLPPVVLRYAREHGARFWVVRLDGVGTCYSLPLSDVERKGWLKPSDGQPEWFVPLSRFRPVEWEDWPYTEPVVRLQQPEQPAARQLMLWG